MSVSLRNIPRPDLQEVPGSLQKSGSNFIARFFEIIEPEEILIIGIIIFLLMENESTDMILIAALIYLLTGWPLSML